MHVNRQGEAIPIYVKDEDKGSHRIVKENLFRILTQDEVKDCNIMVLSVAGAMREGKSFILNMFIRFLESGMSKNWMECNESDLTGFSWRGGTNSNTMGILMWSKPYFPTLSDGSKVAILLVDTQGAFDNENDIAQSSKIITMSLAISSHLIYNVNKCLRSDKLEFFEMFLEYARMAEDGKNTNIFQALTFLVRDWPNSDEHPYGAGGGMTYIDDQLSRGSRDNGKKEKFKKMFEHVSGFLLPYPGKKVASSKKENFSGAFTDIAREFNEYLDELVHLIFDPNNITRKTFDRQPIRGRELAEFALQFSKILESDELPTPKDFIKAQTEAFENNMIYELRGEFKSIIAKAYDGKPFVDDASLVQITENAIEVVIKNLSNKAFYGGDDHKERCKTSLEQILQKDVSVLKDQNKTNMDACQMEYDAFLKNMENNFIEALQKNFPDWVKEKQLVQFCASFKSDVLARDFEGIKCRSDKFDEEYSLLIETTMKRKLDDAISLNKDKLKLLTHSLEQQVSDAFEEAKETLHKRLHQTVVENSPEMDSIVKKIIEDTNKTWGMKQSLPELPKLEFGEKLSGDLHKLYDIAKEMNDRNKEEFNQQIEDKLKKGQTFFTGQIKKEVGKKIKNRSELESIRRKCIEQTMTLIREMELNEYVEKMCMQKLDNRLKREFKLVREQYEENEQKLRESCQIELKKCCESAREEMKTKCENNVKEVKEIQEIHRLLLLKTSHQLRESISDCPIDVILSIKKDLENFLKDLLSEMIEENEKLKRTVSDELASIADEKASQYHKKMSEELNQLDPIEDVEINKIHRKYKANILKEYEELSQTKPQSIVLEQRSNLIRLVERKFGIIRGRNKKNMDEQRKKEDAAQEKCIGIYNEEMEKACEDLLDEIRIKELHVKARDKVHIQLEQMSDLTARIRTRVKEALPEKIDKRFECYRQTSKREKELAKRSSVAILKDLKSEFGRIFESKTKGEACSDEKVIQYFKEIEEKCKAYLLRRNITQIERQFCEQNLEDTFDKWEAECRAKMKIAVTELRNRCEESLEKSKRIYKQNIKIVLNADITEGIDLAPHHHKACDEAMGSFEQDHLQGNKDIVHSYKVKLEDWFKIEWGYIEFARTKGGITGKDYENLAETSKACNCCQAMNTVMKTLEKIKEDLESVKHNQETFKSELEVISKSLKKGKK